MATEPAPEAELKTLALDLKKATDEVKSFAERAQTEMKNLGKMTSETKEDADKAIAGMVALTKKFDEANARIADIEQKSVRRGGPAIEHKTLGDRVVENDAVKSLMTSQRGQARVVVEMKDITSAPSTQGSTADVSTSLVVAQRMPIVNLPERRFTIRDLLTPGETSSNNIEYPVETTFTNAAAMVAEGAAKPQSDVAFDLRSAPVRTLAHFMKASRQILDDAAQLRTYIDGRLRYGLALVEENQLLNGDGTGQNILGLLPQATAYSAPFAVTGETDIDRVRLAILQATQALWPTTGIVLNVMDWAKIEMIKDSMGRYLIGDPTGQLVPRLWGLPVVATVAMTSGHFLVGAFKMGAQIFDRMQVEVLLSTEDVDNFQKNMITIRGEERLGLAVYRPGAFITGTLPQ